MDSHSPQLALVAVKHPQLQVLVASGAGRLLGKAYTTGGQLVGKKVNRWAHRLGHGPDAVTQRIWGHFQNPADRVVQLTNVSMGNIHPDLERDCPKLMKHALPCETRATQLRAFINIVTLTTRLPHLRQLFLRCKYIKAAGASRESLVELWEGAEDLPKGDSEWSFFLQFAASCITDEFQLASLVENRKPTDFVRVPIDNGEYSAAERLHVASESSDQFESRISVRYLGGILGLPLFWDQESHQNYLTVVWKLFKRARQLVEDLDVGHILTSKDALSEIQADVRGIDIITSALLTGVRYKQARRDFFDNFLGDLRRLIELVLQPGVEILLPQARHAASNDWTPLFRITFTPELADVLVHEISQDEDADNHSISDSNHPIIAESLPSGGYGRQVSSKVLVGTLRDSELEEEEEKQDGRSWAVIEDDVPSATSQTGQNRASNKTQSRTSRFWSNIFRRDNRRDIGDYPSVGNGNPMLSNAVENSAIPGSVPVISHPDGHYQRRVQTTDFSHLPPSPSSASIQQFLRRTASSGSSHPPSLNPADKDASQNQLSQNVAHSLLRGTQEGWSGLDDEATTEALRKLDGLRGKSARLKDGESPFSGEDAAIMAAAFRKALRNPDFASHPLGEARENNGSASMEGIEWEH